MMSRSQSNPRLMQYGVILCAIITATIHIYLSFQFINAPDWVFLLNGLGYLALVVVLYLPVTALSAYRTPLRWLLIAYSALTIVLWILLGARTTIGYLDKLIEIALIIFLWLDSQRTR